MAGRHLLGLCVGIDEVALRRLRIRLVPVRGLSIGLLLFDITRLAGVLTGGMLTAKEPISYDLEAQPLREATGYFLLKLRQA